MRHDMLHANQSPPKLLDVVRDRIRAKHYSLRIEKAYVEWIRRHIRFHDKLHRWESDAAEMEQFLAALAVERSLAASTQNQSLAALLLLYREVLGIELPWLDGIVRAKVPQRCKRAQTRISCPPSTLST